MRGNPWRRNHWYVYHAVGKDLRLQKGLWIFDISDERLELAKRLGADEVVNTTKEDYMKTAMELTGNKGYGYVFETAGQVPTMHMAFELAANKAHVCFIGTPHVDLSFTPAQDGKT